MDGWITIGTKLDTKPLDKKLRKLESSLENQEIDLKIKAENIEEAKRQLKEVEIAMKNISKNNEESKERLKSLTKQYETFNKRIAEGDHLTTEEYRRHGRLTNDIAKLQSSQEKVNKEMDKYNSKFNKLYDSLNKAEVSYDKQKNRVEETKQQIIDVNNQIKKNNLQDTENRLKNISASTGHVVKKIIRWGLAIFSIRSAYNFIRQSVSTLSQYNEKLATDIEYLRYSIASSLQPLIENIVKLIYKILAYINYISQAWFGVNIFANASVKAFDKVRKSLSGSNKKAKELQKTLAGFDEMNILQDGSTTRGGGGGGISLPSMDLANMEDVPIPSWIKWIADNGPYVVTILGAIGAALVAMKLTTFIGGLMGITEGLSMFSAGIGTLLAGLVLLGGSIANLIINWDNMTIAQKQASVELASLGGALAALGLVITGLVSGPVGALIAGISLLGGFIANIIIEQNEQAKSTMSVAKAEENLKNARENLNAATNNYSIALKNVNSAQKKLEEAEKKAKQSGKELYNQVMLGIIDFDNMTATQKDLYFKYLDNIEAEAKYKKMTDELREANDKATGAEQQKAASIYASTGKYTDYFNTLIKGYEDGKVSSQKMQNVVTNIMTLLDDETRKTFAENLPNSVKTGFQKTLDELGKADLKIKDASSGITISYKDIASSAKTTFEKNVPNSIQKSIDKIKSLTKELGNLSKTGAVSISTTVKSVTGSRNAKGAIYYPPKLATGGIINMPGRGVPLGAIGGEHGAEGVIPLTDQEAMARLGAEIGRNVVINTILNNYMNSRLISREQQKTSNIDKFAFNG